MEQGGPGAQAGRDTPGEPQLQGPAGTGLGEGREGSQRVPVPRSSPSMSLFVDLGTAKHISEGCASYLL